MILKVSGVILISAGCVGLGIYYREQFAQRIVHIRILIYILDQMISEVRYNKSVLPECCLKLVGRLKNPYKEAFENTYRRICRNEGDAFGEILRRELAEAFERTPLGKEEKKLFLQFAGECGYTETGMQITQMEQYRDQLEEVRDQLEKEVAEKKRMALGLGVMSGLLLVIVLL